MAGTGNDSQKQLLSIIRNFATEKSQGERRVVTLRKQFETLKSDLSIANAELEKFKRCKELVEQELKGFELHFDQFIRNMLDLNAKIRKFLESIVACNAVEYAACGGSVILPTVIDDDFLPMLILCNEQQSANFVTTRESRVNSLVQHVAPVNTGVSMIWSALMIVAWGWPVPLLGWDWPSPEHKSCIFQQNGKRIKIDFEFVSDPAPVTIKENDTDAALGALESRLSEILSQTTKEDDEFQAQQEIYKNVSSNSNAIKSRLSSKLEATYSSLGEELQNRSMCPKCHLDNLEALTASLQANEEN
ncbi:hypothetical protein TSUD_337030 [Trifolium subterraneum]|uniref:Uncharacterized protein n=1 Tax=Trifolium subterraneum TaxID=3900 RepID=A0A2Z6MIP4_TRISU|nr:hypothetical protein TSUD_337030 [Trifolium subterraneum]